MKYLKTYESNNVKLPNVGDLILIHIDFEDLPEDPREIQLLVLKIFVNETIGKVIHVDDKNHRRLEDIYVTVKYNNIPDIILPWFFNNTRRFKLDAIVDMTQRELGSRLAAKKYSLK